MSKLPNNVIVVTLSEKITAHHPVINVQFSGH